MLKNLLYILILIVGFPIGVFLSRLCKDEIKNWRKRFIGISLVSLFGVIFIIFTNIKYKFPVIMGLFFLIIIFLVVVWKSYDK